MASASAAGGGVVGSGAGVAAVGPGVGLGAGSAWSQAASDAPTTTTAWKRRESGRAIRHQHSESHVPVRAAFWYKGEVTRAGVLSWFKLIALALALGCGSSSSTHGAASDPSGGSGGDAPQDPSVEPVEPMPPIEPTRPGLDPSDPSLEVDPQICAVDADCMIGTPRDCCTGFCPEHRQAWSRAAWAEYQDLCAIVECAQPESLACQPELDVNPPTRAVCVHERCVLR
jgi:hypothetical protein